MGRLERQVRDTFETLEGESLKNLAEFTLNKLAASQLGEPILHLVRGGSRIVDPRLATEVAGIPFENPLMVGAGWDKKGLAVDGLYSLGFAGTEVGSVLEHPQSGNPKPRLFTDSTHSVGLNRMGFNSDGADKVEQNLCRQKRHGVLGISIGKNKEVAEKDAPEAHAAVARKLSYLADYMVINVSSPNTPGLRNLLTRKPLTDNIQAVKEVLDERTPLFVKTTVDLALHDLDTVLEVCVNEGVTGVIDTNTTIDDDIKEFYGWMGQAGGVSGNDAAFRMKATQHMKHIAKETKGTGLVRIGVGGINDAESAMERIQAGAEVLQVVTRIRQNKGLAAKKILSGLVVMMDRDGAKNINEYVGIAVE